MNAITYKYLFAFLALSLTLARAETVEQVQTSQARSDNTRTFIKPTTYGDFDDEHTFKFSAFGQIFTIKNNGQGSRAGANSRVTRFRLKLDKLFYIESLSFLEHEDSVILLCGVTDAEAGGGGVYCLNRGNLRISWYAHIPGFNIGETLVEDNYAYITAIGFISKLDLRSGQYVWKHEDLYERNHVFNNFEPPELAGDKVIFRGAGIYGTRPRTIEVDKRSGEILAMKD
jgi:hypothetical protein